jgi:hypothetical protein
METQVKTKKIYKHEDDSVKLQKIYVFIHLFIVYYMNLPVPQNYMPSNGWMIRECAMT